MTPEIGSKWKTRDGRHYEVMEVVADPAIIRPYAVLRLLNERVNVGDDGKWRRRGVKMALRRFPTYLRPLDEDGWTVRRHGRITRGEIAIPPADYLERLRAALVYHPETGKFTWAVDRSRTKTGTPAGSWNLKGYQLIRFEGRGNLAHRLVWWLETGTFPAHDLDHKDGDRGNNVITNLRPCTDQQNQRNRKSQGGKSRYKGVSQAKNKWVATIDRSYLGNFETEEEAARAHDRAAIARDPEFAWTNFPRSDYAAKAA